MYVALKRQRFGEAHLAPGDEVPVEEGRNYNLMLRMGLIADVEATGLSEEGAAQAQGALKARIAKLELMLTEAQAEIRSLREQVGLPAQSAEEASAGEASEPAPTMIELEDLTKAHLLELLGNRTVPANANKTQILEVLKGADTEE